MRAAVRVLAALVVAWIGLVPATSVEAAQAPTARARAGSGKRLVRVLIQWALTHRDEIDRLDSASQHRAS